MDPEEFRLPSSQEKPPPRHGINGWTDDALFDGMKRFQKKNGLQVDGVARPSGPTETTLNAALADGLKPATPTKSEGPSSGWSLGQATAKPKVTQPPGHAPTKKPKVFNVGAGVGAGQANRPQDVQGAKRTLAWAGYYPNAKAQAATEEVDEDLKWGLWGFQRDFGLKQDGYMAPNGQTATTLDALVAPLVRAAFGVETQFATGQARAAQTRAEQRPEEVPPEETPPQAPPEPAPDEQGEGGGNESGIDEEPDTDHGRQCAEYQRQRDEWEESLRQWTEDMLFLSNNDISRLEGEERARYLALIQEHTGFSGSPHKLTPSETPSSSRKPVRPKDAPDHDRRKPGKLGRILDGLDKLGNVVGPILDEVDRVARDKEWEQRVREERNKAVVKLNERRKHASDRIQEIIDKADGIDCFSESPSSTGRR